MAFTPFIQRLENNWHNPDQYAAAWRIYAAQIESSEQHGNFRTLVGNLNGAWVAYSRTKHTERLQRFKLDRTISGAIDISGLDDYGAVMETVANQTVVRKLNNLISHISNEYSVDRGILAGIVVGRLYETLELKTKPTEDAMRLIGASQLVTEVPRPALAGKYNPTRFGSEGGYRKSGRRRSRIPRYNY